jgi:hypothetical protein
MVSAMVLAGTTLGARIRDTVNTFRVAVLATIAFLAFLMVVVALVAAVYDVSDRAMAIIGVVLAALPTLVTSLIVYLKVDNVEVKADTAARRAQIAARRAEIVEGKVDTVQSFVENGGLRDNVKRAISEDRHALRNREANDKLRKQLEERAASPPDRDAPTRADEWSTNPDD